MSKRIEETLEILKRHAAQHEAVAVSYSAGKDSVVVLDLCSRAFKRVEAFYLYVVPGLDCIDKDLAEAEMRYRIAIHHYPNPSLRQALKEGTYCPNSFRTDDLPQWKQKDVYALARIECNATLIANGQKRVDSMDRRTYIDNGRENVITPVAGWTHLDILTYMKMRGLPIPRTQRRTQRRTLMSGVTLTVPSILWLYDNHPDDFKRMESVFPYIGAVPARRAMYNIAE